MDGRTLVAALAVVAAVAVAVPAVAVAGADGPGLQDNETNDTTAPGERLAGVVGVQGAEVDGELAERSFRVGLNRSAAGASAVVDERLPALERQVEEIERRRAALSAARENGSISEGEYRARMATLVAESRNVRHMTNLSSEALADEPGVLDQERGERIRALRQRAGNVTGPGIAELARGIAGEHAGGGLGPGGGPPEDVGNATDGDRGPDVGPGPQRGAGANESTADDGNTTADGDETTTAGSDATVDGSGSTLAAVAASATATVVPEP
ncbi:hypothetical protein [Halostella litorea]|uniref:hypothetical protein n=1 Tax=Halostella litorea TaxID=2528831 RepID=UPI00109302A3|nr:hypothetical protein [Halostella litorea]